MGPIGASNQLGILGNALGYKQGGAPSNVLGYQPSSGGGGGGGGSSSGGGGGGSYSAAPAYHAPAPPPDPGIAIANQLKGQIGSRMGDLNNIYNSIYGQIDQSAQSQRNTLEGEYNNQFQTLQDQFAQNARTLPGMFAARGTADSSDSFNAQQDARNLYKDNNQAIQNDEDKSMKSLAQYVNQQKAIYHGQQDALGQYNLGMYPSSSASLYGLQSLYNNLVQQEATAKGAAGGFGSDSAFVQQLNSIAPSQNDGAKQLQGQLDTLKGASLPQFAQDQIASAIINKNTQNDPTQQGYWLNYYQNMNGQKA